MSPVSSSAHLIHLHQDSNLSYDDSKLSGDEKDDLDLQFDSIDDVLPASYEEHHGLHHNLPPVQQHHSLPQVHEHVDQQFHDEIDEHDVHTLQSIQQDEAQPAKVSMKTVHFGNVDGVNNDERKLLSVELPAPAPAIVAKPNHEPLVAKPNHEPPEDNLNEKKIKTLLSFATVTGMKTSPIKRFDTRVEQPPQDPISKAQQVIIAKTKPTTELEIALAAELERNKCLIANVTNELNKIKQFISKRKQTYKRKRKDGGAPKRALSAYNIYIKEKFKILAQENQDALTDANTEKALQRIKPENLVARTGNEWKKLSSEEKQKYEEKAKADKKRYKDEVASYNPPEPIPNKRRNKTGYNVFFTAHVNRVKENDTRLPSERGSVARMVGNAWKVSYS
jgi:hypothetical protein